MIVVVPVDEDVDDLNDPGEAHDGEELEEEDHLLLGDVHHRNKVARVASHGLLLKSGELGMSI